MRRIITSIILCLAVLSMTGAPAAAAPAPQILEIKVSKADQKKYEDAFEKVMLHFQKFEAYLQDNKIDEAMDELKAVIDVQFPEGSEGTDGVMLQVESHIFLGELYVEDSAGKKGKKKEEALNKAVAVFLAGITRAPAVDDCTVDLYMGLGHAYKMQGRSKDALAAFEKAEDIKEALKKQQSH